MHLKCVQVYAHFFKKFNILGISTKLIILCCFSLTTDPATWKNSRHLSKGFLYPFVLGPFSIVPACVLLYSSQAVHFFRPLLFAYPHLLLQVLVVLITFWHFIRMQAFFGGECNLFLFLKTCL